MKARIIFLLVSFLVVPRLSLAQLRAGEASVEFSFDNGHYMASVLKNGWRTPRVVDLCSGERVDVLAKDPSLYEGKKAAEMYSLILRPLENALGNVKTVFFRPAGMIHFVNLAALVDENGRRCMDRYEFRRVSDLGNLPRETKGKWYPNDIYAYGAMDYKADPAEMIRYAWTAHTRYASGKYADSSGWNTTDLYFGTAEDGTRAGYRNLSGSRDEMRFIYRLGNSFFTTVNTGAKAVEESFRMDASRQNPYAMHISTHSFTVSPPKGTDLSGMTEREISYKSCGLLFSGAGHTLEGEAMVASISNGGMAFEYRLNDGLLYGEEIASLNMEACDLLVLAACGTALGRVSQDGVIGLQSAFKEAGVKTILMTLWSVNDNATAEFMERFYSYLMEGHTKHESLDRARRDMMKSPDWSSPLYWAPFIMLD